MSIAFSLFFFRFPIYRFRYKVYNNLENPTLSVDKMRKTDTILSIKIGGIKLMHEMKIQPAYYEAILNGNKRIVS